MSAVITAKNEIPANAVYTMEIISRHRHGMNARAKVAKLQAEAPANVCYEHIVDQDGRIMIHHVYRYTVINMPTAATEVSTASITGNDCIEGACEACETSRCGHFCHNDDEPDGDDQDGGGDVDTIPAVKPRFVVNQLGFRYYAVRDTKLGKNVRTMCGDKDAEQQAIDAAAELNATDK